MYTGAMYKVIVCAFTIACLQSAARADSAAFIGTWEGSGTWKMTCSEGSGDPFEKQVSVRLVVKPAPNGGNRLPVEYSYCVADAQWHTAKGEKYPYLIVDRINTKVAHIEMSPPRDSTSGFKVTQNFDLRLTSENVLKCKHDGLLHPARGVWQRDLRTFTLQRKSSMSKAIEHVIDYISLPGDWDSDRFLAEVTKSVDVVSVSKGLTRGESMMLDIKERFGAKTANRERVNSVATECADLAMLCELKHKHTNKFLFPSLKTAMPIVMNLKLKYINGDDSAKVSCDRFVKLVLRRDTENILKAIEAKAK